MSIENRPDKVTVVVPTYNRAELLKVCIQSVLSQTHSNIELIVIDDGSTDSTQEYLQSCQDSRLRVFRHDRKGAQTARNRGMFEATGNYISFLDDDDLWHPDKLRCQVDRFLGAADLDGVICQTVWFKEWPGDHNYLFNRLHDGDPLTRFLRLDVVWQTAAPLWKLEFARRVGPWDERLTSGQDLDFHTRCLCLEPRLEYVDSVLNFFREHPGIRITKDRKEAHPANALYAMENAHRLLRSRGTLTPDRGLALASTLMRQSRTLALYGENQLVRECLTLAKDSHPSGIGRFAVSGLLAPLDALIGVMRPMKPVARALRKATQILMYGTGLELRRVQWWQHYPYEGSIGIQRPKGSESESGPDRAKS